jgi:hypothetical protein
MLLNELFENAPSLDSQKAINDLDTLETSIESLPDSPENDQTKKSVIARLKQLSDAVTSFVAKAAGQPQQANGVSEDALDDSVAAIIDNLKQQITAIEQLDIDDAVKKQFIAPVRQNLDKLTSQVQKLTTVKNKAIKTADEAKAFVKEVSGYLVTLGNKVQDFTEVDNFDSLNSNERKKVINAQKFTSTLKQALFGKVVEIQEEVINPNDIKAFLKNCVDGKVIDMKALITNPTGNVRDFVVNNRVNNKMFDIFVNQDIFSYAPGTTSGGVGPGEMALSMMGNPAQKGKTGDLLIDGKEIEIKAGGQKGSGGRLNSKELTKPTTGWKVWSKNISQILQNAPNEPLTRVTNAKSGATSTLTTSMRGWDGNAKNIQKSGKSKLGSQYNYGPGGIDNLNSEVLEPYSSQQQTSQMFIETFKSMTGNWDQIDVPKDELINKAINADGTIDYNEMTKAWSRIAYESYRLSDGIQVIMFLRTDSLNFVIIDDGDDFINKFDSLKVSGFVWNDDQQNPTPGFLPSN